MSTEINILQLPPEILTVICQLLELPDRKRIRLTCKSFYDACNCISIISQEKIVIRNEFVQDFTKTLFSCQYLRLDLEFQGFPLNTLPGEIWSQCGERIYSLTFHWSSVNHKVLENVIIHCQNLKHWEVWIGSSELLHSMLSHEGLIKPFQELVERKVIRNELETFKIFIDTDCESSEYPYEVSIGIKSIWTSLIERIFVIFPKLKTFGVLCCCSKNPINYLDPVPCQKFAFNPVDDCLIPANVEGLLIDIPSDGNWLKNSSLWNLRLKEIQTSLYDTERILEMLLTFFSHQKLLEIINLTVNDISSELLKKLLFHILKVCPNLRRLQINYPDVYIIPLSDFEFSLLQEQRLEFLKLPFEVDDPLLDKILMNVKLPVNQSLHTLIINSYVSDNDYLLLLEYFQNLKHLDVCCVSDVVLQTIFKNHVNLEVLKLNNVDDCTDCGFTGRDRYGYPLPTAYSIRRLKNLRCLDINGEFDVKITEYTLLEFVFPKLKHVRFSFGNEDCIGVEGNFVKIAENAPLLEVVILDLPEMELNDLLDFCPKLKNLYYLSFATEHYDEDYVALFPSCPSLRFVALPKSDKILYFNPFTKDISSSELNDPSIHFKWSVEFAKVDFAKVEL